MNVEIDEMTESVAKNYLKIIVDALNELDEDDYFGTEGWRKFFDLED